MFLLEPSTVSRILDIVAECGTEIVQLKFVNVINPVSGVLENKIHMNKNCSIWQSYLRNNYPISNPLASVTMRRPATKPTWQMKASVSANAPPTSAAPKGAGGKLMGLASQVEGLSRPPPLLAAK